MRSVCKAARRGASRKAMSTLSVDNPYSGAVAAEVAQLGDADTMALIDGSAAVQKDWSKVSIDQRIAVCKQFMADFEANKDAIATSVTAQMGKPYGQSCGEVGTVIERATAMIGMAKEQLADAEMTEKDGFFRKIAKEPVGVVLTIAPWNYPLACAINSVIPAVLAGNTVVLKHSSRTPLCSEHIADAFDSASESVLGMKGVVTSLQCGHGQVAKAISHDKVRSAARAAVVLCLGLDTYSLLFLSGFLLNTQYSILIYSTLLVHYILSRRSSLL